MRRHEDCFPALHKRPDSIEAFPAKISIPDPQNLIDDEDIRINARRDREGQTHVHSIRIGFHWLMDEILQLGKRHDVGIEPVDLFLGQSEIHPADVDILLPGQLRMKSSPDLQKSRDLPFDLHFPFGGTGVPGENPQQGALPCSVSADDPYCRSLRNLKAHIVEGAKFFIVASFSETETKKIQ